MLRSPTGACSRALRTTGPDPKLPHEVMLASSPPPNYFVRSGLKFLRMCPSFSRAYAKVYFNQRVGKFELSQFHSETGLRHNGLVAMIAGGSLERDTDLASLATLSGCTPLVMDDSQAADFLLVNILSEMEILEASVTRINKYLEVYNSIVLIWSTMDVVKEIYAAFPLGQYHVMVEALDVEAKPILAGAFGRDSMARLRDTGREVEFASLHRISDELAEFARTLARLAESEQKDKLSEKPVSFRPAPRDGFQEFPESSPFTDHMAGPPNLREIIKLRRLRDSFFQPDLFADPAWDILLDLKAAAQEGRQVSVSSLCIAAAVPPTTALRWITAMAQSGMLVRRQDPADARRVFIELSAETSAKLDDYFAALTTRSAPMI